MDMWALFAMAIGAVLWFITRNKPGNVTWNKVGIWIFGIGCGLLIGALWAVQIISKAFTR